MPLANHFPQLDNRRFDDIVAEARARIPRYTPEWTDYNPGDAGFALVELFAWMTELLVYRLNQVPKLNYLKFLELIGIELRPALSATAALVFPVQPAFANPFVIVPARTQVATAEPDEAGRPIIFETDRLLTALRAKLDAVQAFDGFAYSDLSKLNAEPGDGFEPFGPLANPDSALVLGLRDTGELPAGVELALAFWPKASAKEPPPSPCGQGPSAVSAPATLRWEFWAGTEWRKLDVLIDETLAFTRSGFLRLKTPAKGQAVKAKIGAVTDAPRFWLRARLVKSSYPQPPRLLAVRANAVSATEAQTVQDEVVGGSDGSPDQVMRLANSPIKPDSLELQVYETDTPETWRAVPDFFGVAADAAVYVPNWATGEVRFPGRDGRIPVANIDRPQTNVVARIYRFGGGTRGNVAAGQISALMGGIAGLDAGGVTNPVAAAGGADEEAIDAAMLRAPLLLKARNRAVTPDDFEALAKEAGPIARAKALPLSHPDFPDVEVPGVVTVIVVPDVDAASSPAPRPSEPLLRTVCAYLDMRRLLTTELYVVGPKYVPVRIEFEAILNPDADAAETKEAMAAAIRKFLHPLTGGNQGIGWPFGGAIRYADFYRAAAIDGVARLENIKIVRDEQEFGQCTDVPLPAGALVALEALDIAVREEMEVAA